MAKISRKSAVNIGRHEKIIKSSKSSDPDSTSDYLSNQKGMDNQAVFSSVVVTARLITAEFSG